LIATGNNNLGKVCKSSYFIGFLGEIMVFEGQYLKRFLKKRRGGKRIQVNFN